MPKLKIVLATLLLLFIVLIAARYTVFSSAMAFQKQQSRNLAVNALHLKKMVIQSQTLYQNTDKMQWMDNRKEVLVDGEMYEVAAIKKDNGLSVLYLLADSKESGWLAAFNKIDGSQNKQWQDLFQLLTLIGFYVVGLGLLLGQWRTSQNINYVRLSYQTVSQFQSGLIKPPSLSC